jgi:stage V sporulation protein S
MNNEITQPFRVSAKSSPASLAGAITGVIRETGRCEVQAIGAGAVNQAVKAIAIARGYVAPAGMDLVITPGFLDVEVGGEERTAIRFVIEPR